MWKVVKDAGKTSGSDRDREELDNYRRLVELQSQIVELARRNTETERSCRILRDRLARQGLGGPQGRIGKALLGLLERMRNRMVRPSQSTRREGSMSLPLPFPSASHPVESQVRPSNHPT